MARWSGIVSPGLGFAVHAVFAGEPAVPWTLNPPDLDTMVMVMRFHPSIAAP